MTFNDVMISLRLDIFLWTDDKSSFLAGARRYDFSSLELDCSLMLRSIGRAAKILEGKVQRGW